MPIRRQAALAAILLALAAAPVFAAPLLPPSPPLSAVVRTPVVARDMAGKPARTGAIPPKPQARPLGSAPDAPLLEAPDGRVLLSGPAPKPGANPELINLSGAVEADDVAVVDGELIFSGLDMGDWSEMLMSVSDSYSAWGAALIPGSDDATATLFELQSSRMTAAVNPELPRPATLARIANRDFSAGITAAWIPVGYGQLTTSKSLMIETKTYRSPAKGAGTFLVARPAGPGLPAGVEQQIEVADGEQINFSLLFSSPGQAAGDEISVDLVRDGVDVPLYMASGIQSREPGWQSIGFTVPPGGSGRYHLRLTLTAARGTSGQLPVAAFFVEAAAHVADFEQHGPGTMQ